MDKSGNSSSSCANSFLRWLNLLLILGSCASIGIIVLLRWTPTLWGWAFIAAVAVSILSGFVGFFSRASRACFAAQAALLLTSVAMQGLAFLMMFARRGEVEERLQPTRNERETRILMKANGALLVGMFCLEMQILVVACSLQLCRSVGDYHGLGDDVERSKAKGRRRSIGRKMARVQEEALANAAMAEEVRAADFNDKIQLKYEKWRNEKE